MTGRERRIITALLLLYCVLAVAATATACHYGG
jgi:hypothetical protein